MKSKETTSESELKITLKCFFGFEQTLGEELIELGYDKIEFLNRAVRINGSWEDVYFLNLYIRCAISILVEIEHFFIKSEDDLYKKASGIYWNEIFSANKTFAIKGAVFSTLFKNTHYPFLVLKDAIVDCFRETQNERPNIDLKKPQVLFDLYIKENEVTISVNTSGLPLFQRGYREEVGEAPLNEVVAASLIRQSGWDRTTTFMDPFCGSGTILIEAAFLATGIPSNIERQHYAFKNLNNYDEKLWNEIYGSAPRIVRSLPCEIIGSDISDEMIMKTRRNLRSMSFGRFVKTSVLPFDQVTKTEEKLFILTNPPYGERMETDIPELYDTLGTWMKHSMTNSEAWIISSSEEGWKSIGLKPTKKTKVFNGDLECSFRKFEIYDGSKKAKNEESYSEE